MVEQSIENRRKPFFIPTKELGWVLGILLVALIHGLIYVFLMPPWQHYDEPSHFEYAWLLAQRRRLPQPGESDPQMRLAVTSSMLKYGFYDGFDVIPELDEATQSFWRTAFSQLDEPPAYYLLASLPVVLLPTDDVTLQLYSMRFVSLALYLVSILGAYGSMREITPEGHSLRWIVPLSIALLPGFADLMTAVNNDVAAAAFFSLFIWGGLRLLQHGFTLLRLLWLAVTAALCFWTKSTVFLAVPFLGLALVFWLLQRLNRAWAWAGLVAVAALLTVALLSWGDAALWYRATSQGLSTRVQHPQAPIGEYAIQVDATAAVTPTWLAPVSQPIPLAAVDALEEKQFTLGAWIWASAPAQVNTPTLTNGSKTFREQVVVDQAPNFFALPVAFSNPISRLWIDLAPFPRQQPANVTVYYDGLVLVPGQQPIDEAPAYLDAHGEQVNWGGETLDNLVRNASAERAWPRVWYLADDFGTRFLPDQSRPSMILSTILDPPGAGHYYREAGAQLVRTFWAQFGWAHVRLLGRKPYRWLFLFSLIGAAGAAWAIWRRRRTLRWDVLGWLAIVSVVVWIGVLTRGSTYIFVLRIFLPASRYAYPVVLPTMLIVSAGWREILAQLGRPLGFSPKIRYLAFFAFLVGLDLLSIFSIYRYYAGS